MVSLPLLTSWFIAMAFRLVCTLLRVIVVFPDHTHFCMARNANFSCKLMEIVAQ